MEVSIRTEQELARTAQQHGISFSVNKTNSQIATKLLRRQLTFPPLTTPLHPNPTLHSNPISNRFHYSEIQLDQNSCYLDAFVNLLLRPEMEDALWLSTSFSQSQSQSLCKNQLLRVKDMWRESIFTLLQNNRISLRPFLETLKDCEEIISSETPFWRTCLNDPLEFIHNIYTPILCNSPSSILDQNYAELKKYTTVPG